MTSVALLLIQRICRDYNIKLSKEQLDKILEKVTPMTTQGELVKLVRNV